MQQFTVPQFIDVEDKIFGPVTARQFSIMIGAVGPIFLAYKLADFALFVFIAILIGGTAAMFAFVRINGQAFHYFVLNILQTLRRPSRRLWYKSYTNASLQDFLNYEKQNVKDKLDAEDNKIEKKVISNTRIRDLSLLVNTGGYFKV
ncbi:MAG: PrgI family protein [Patescibacteria group bacterium]|jgi:hypothetical protein